MYFGVANLHSNLPSIFTDNNIVSGLVNIINVHGKDMSGGRR